MKSRLLRFLRSLFQPTIDHTLIEQTQLVVGEISQGVKRSKTYAEALTGEERKPPATYGRECDFYDTCPFRSNAAATRAIIRRLNRPLD